MVKVAKLPEVFRHSISHQRRGLNTAVRVLSGTPLLRRVRFCDLLGLCQKGPTFGQDEPRPSVLAIVAHVCLTKAFSDFNATVLLSDIATS